MKTYEWAHAALTALRRGDTKSALEFIEVTCAETSYLELIFCEAKYGEHDWIEQEPDMMMKGNWEKCSRCGCSRMTTEPPKLEVVG